jgi:hypothetical protein
MTMAMAFVPFASGSPGLQVTESAYRPGACNIGPDEIRRRRRAGHVGVVATIALFLILVAIDAPPIARLLVALPAAMAASGYLQAWFRFCAGFASRGVFNFGSVGETHAVVDDEARALDRARARRLAMASLGIGIAVGVAAVIVPL